MTGTSNLTATGLRELEAQPPQRPDLEGQNIEAVRYGLARSIRETVATLNHQMENAHSIGLVVAINSASMLTPDASNYAVVSIFERRKY